MSRVGQKSEGRGSGRKDGCDMAKARTNRNSRYLPGDVGDLQYKLIPFTTVPVHLDSECREAEGDDPVGAGGAAQVPKAVMQGMNCKHA